MHKKRAQQFIAVLENIKLFEILELLEHGFLESGVLVKLYTLCFNDRSGSLGNEALIVELALGALDLVFDVQDLLLEALDLLGDINELFKGQESFTGYADRGNRVLGSVGAAVDNADGGSGGKALKVDRAALDGLAVKIGCGQEHDARLLGGGNIALDSDNANCLDDVHNAFHIGRACASPSKSSALGQSDSIR